MLKDKHLHQLLDPENPRYRRNTGFAGDGSRRSPEERAAGTQQEEGDHGVCVPRYERKKKPRC